ncbi:MAG: hypothetical protein ACTHZ6_15725 [Brevibacterium aurantiacum]|uniref:hypothetical protein n=1 Tax=Brevibacterium aurantiacum TaxID=273384 RepID=UPI003F92739C
MAETESKSPFNVWWFGAGAFVILVLIGGVLLGFQLGSSDDGEPAAAETPAEEAAPEQSAPAVEDTPAADDEARECGSLSTDQDYPTEAPPTEWETYASSSMTVPISEEYGPVNRDGNLWGCYAHSPTGAVYAGLGLIASFSIGGEYDAAVDTAQAESAFEDQSAAAGASFPSFSGFRIDEYSDDAARITYYGDQGEHSAGISFSLKWDEQADDWRLDWTRPDGFEENPDPEQFVMWER